MNANKITTSKTRYCKDEYCFWKFESSGQALSRNKDQSIWMPSVFLTIEDALLCGGIYEITADEGEPLGRVGMNADTITTDRLADLKSMLQTATDTVSRLHLQAINGDISTQDAAAIVNETAETINQFCKD